MPILTRVKLHKTHETFSKGLLNIQNVCCIRRRIYLTSFVSCFSQICEKVKIGIRICNPLYYSQTTYMNSRHVHCLPSPAPTLDFWLEITKIRNVCISGIDLNYKFLNSSSYFTASRNGTTRQTAESWCSWRFCIAFSETGFTGQR